MNARHHLFVAAASATSLTLAACGGGGDALFDQDRACRDAEDLVEAAMISDEDDVRDELADLEELTGVGGSDLDLDAIDELVSDGELDEDTAEDLVGEFDAIDCEIDIDELQTAEPVDTTVVATDVPDTTGDITVAPPTAPPGTPAPPTTGAPPTTEAPSTTEAPPSTTVATTEAPEPTDATRTNSGEGIAVDVGAEALPEQLDVGLERDPAELVAEFGLDGFIYPAGAGSRVFEFSTFVTDTGRDYRSRNDTVAVLIRSKVKPRQMLKSFRAEIDPLGGYDYSEFNNSRDDSVSVGFSADVEDYDDRIPNWTVSVTSTRDLPDVYIVSVDSTQSFYEGDTAPPKAYTAEMSDILAATESAGFSPVRWSYSWSVNMFDPSLESERFEHEFEIPENKVAPVVKQLDAELGQLADRKKEGSYTTFSADGAEWMIMDHGRGTATITADG